MGYVFFFICILTVVATGVFTVRGFKTLIKARNLEFGLRGEQATAEALYDVYDLGFKAFHDFQVEKNKWNIDHVVVGTRGVFVIETKARRKRRSNEKLGLGAHEFRLRGDDLILPFATDRKAVPQARRNADWLADKLSKLTAEPVQVKAIVVLPGWFIQDPDDNAAVPAMGHNYLKGYLQGQTPKISPEQVNRIIAYLDEINRTVEF